MLEIYIYADVEWGENSNGREYPLLFSPTTILAPLYLYIDLNY